MIVPPQICVFNMLPKVLQSRARKLLVLLTVFSVAEKTSTRPVTKIVFFHSLDPFNMIRLTQQFGLRQTAFLTNLLLLEAFSRVITVTIIGQ